MGDFKQACSLIPEHEERQGLIETAERLLVNQLVKLHRSKRLVRQLRLGDMADVAMGEVRKFIQKNMPKVWLKQGGQSGVGVGRQQGSWSGKGKGKSEYGAGLSGGKSRMGPCYTCGGVGHIARDCVLGAHVMKGKGAWSQAQQWEAPVGAPFQVPIGPAPVMAQQQQQVISKVTPSVGKGASA